MNWTLEYSRKAEVTIRRLHPRDRQAIKNKLEDCSIDPMNSTKHLVGNLNGLRSLRKGKVRAIVSLHEGDQVIYVESIEYRGNAY